MAAIFAETSKTLSGSLQATNNVITAFAKEGRELDEGHGQSEWGKKPNGN